MIGLSGFKRWAVMAMFAVVAVATFTLVPADGASAGTIVGGKYTVDVKGTKVELENDNTTITLNPNVPGLKPEINNGNIRIPNVPAGTYTVTVNFKVDQKWCETSTAKQILVGLVSPALLAFCKFSGVGATYFGLQKVFTNVVVTDGGTTTLDPKDGNLGSTMQVDANGNPILDCAGKGIIMSFVICPMIENVLGIIDWIVENFIQPYLAINPLTTTVDGKPNELYGIWNNIRNFANVMFILAFFIIIFSQATSIGISNYGIKRLLPRLIIIGIATNVSFFICALLVDIFNILGVGIASLLVVGVTGGTLTFSPGSVDIFVLLAIPLLISPFALLIAPAAAAVIFGVFVFLFIGAVILFIAAIVILLRQIVIIFLVLASPIAFVAGLLPNTQKYLNQWATAFIKLLAMYPILMAMFASGKIASTVLQKVGPVGSGNAPDLAVTIMSFMAFVLPLVFVPFAFKFAGSGLHKLYNSMQQGVQRAGSRAANTASRLGTKAAKNSVPGLRVQQLLNERKASRVRTAQDRNAQFLSGTSASSNLARRLIAGRDPSRQAAFQEQTRNAYQERTQKSMQGKNPIAIGDLAQMRQGETVDAYAARNADIRDGLALRGRVTAGTATADERQRYNNTEQRVAALRDMAGQFGSQIGTDEFREAALRGSVVAGSNTQDIMAGMREYVTSHGGSDSDLAQSLGRIAQDAKASGFAEYSAVGFQRDPGTGARNFEQYQIKAPDAVLRNMDLTKQETGQFIASDASGAAAHGVPVGSRTQLGDAIHGRLTSGDESVRSAMLRDLSMARRSKPFQREYLELVRAADRDRGTVLGHPDSLESQLNDMISRV
jgi:hypothetical protein